MQIKLPAGTFTVPQAPCYEKKSLIVAGGRRPDKNWLATMARDCTVWAADRGADYCREAGIKVSYLYGDRDSVNPADWAAIAATNPVIKTFPPAKNDTDLTLVLQDLPLSAVVIATGIWGGRADHLYANIFSLYAAKQRGQGAVLLADASEVMLLLAAGEEAAFTVAGVLPHAVSLLPLGPENKVSVEGVQWPLEQADLLMTHPYAISNVMQQETMTVSCTKGSIGFYLNFKDGT